MHHQKTQIPIYQILTTLQNTHIVKLSQYITQMFKTIRQISFWGEIHENKHSLLLLKHSLLLL